MQKRGHSVGVHETWTLRYPKANPKGTIPPDITEQRAGFLHDTQFSCYVCIYIYICISIYLEWLITVIV